MIDFESFSEHILNAKSIDFDSKALEIFHFQAVHNPIYAAYLRARGIRSSSVQRVEEIPFLPIQFFKQHAVVSGDLSRMQACYTSSGTTGAITSRHHVWSEAFYLRHARNLFQEHYGPLENFHVLALLPAYLEREGSSLVAMAADFIAASASEHSGFYLYDHDALREKLALLAQQRERKVLLLGVTFALLDLVESGIPLPEFPELIVMETGGMKGRRREMIREEVHAVLRPAFGVEHIHSEYGMTELLSQAYSFGEGVYQLPKTLRVLLRDVHDPLSPAARSQGGINVIDLANFHSCSFIETQDLGRLRQMEH
ncbi:acyl-protein synthetase LuxE [Nitritalea halalkaliphila LW7]|uniref:Acyl-protein synthetase LuxE n=1 Tax=Nitritalea halalkaliphila LW7 TaxID=1189621 RepID=I5C3N4_9BACT|nr:acyltransferase [Nitritalea halalkaliphila]EIM76436.1 acyl-protein synthetase LuxE [Nitritalea halalkaliphila LW7]